MKARVTGWLVLGLIVLLLLVGVARPSLDRDMEISSGEFDSNSDCMVRGDQLNYHTPGNLLDGILGGHGRGFESVQFNQRAFRIVFGPAADEIRLIRVRDCGVHAGGEPIEVDGTVVDVTVSSPRGRVVVDRVPDRGLGPAKRLVIRVPWEEDYQVAEPSVDLETFDLATPLPDARVLVSRGVERKGDGIVYEVYDYAHAHRLRFQFPLSTLPMALDAPVVVKGSSALMRAK